jgi:putative ABC transport system permease protein
MPATCHAPVETGGPPVPRLSEREERAGGRAPFHEYLRITAESVTVYPLRSFLTVLAVMISTMTLVVVISILKGINTYVSERVASLGANVFVVSQFGWGVTNAEWLQQRRRNKPLTIEDYEYLKEAVAGYAKIGAVGWASPRPSVRYGGKSIEDTNATGQTTGMIDMQREQVARGRYFTEHEYRRAASVCFIGHDTASELFGNVDPVGRTVVVGNQPFQVIGVATRLGGVLGQSQDNFVQMPLTSFRKLEGGKPDINIHVQAWSAGQMPLLQDEVRAALRARHHVRYQEADDFGINVALRTLKLWERLSASFQFASVTATAIFMGLSGLVVMNVMLARVHERTREIGIRKSVGARRGDIIGQFAIESVFLSAAGGLLGTAFAAALTAAMPTAVPVVLTGLIALIGLAAPAAVGLIFGIGPAMQACRLDPVEALRVER